LPQASSAPLFKVEAVFVAHYERL